MSKTFKSVVAIAVSASMLLSLAGCSDKANDQVVEAAESYGSAVSSMKYKSISKLISEDADEDMLADLELLCDYSSADGISDETVAIFDAIADTISYEVDAESVDASTKDAEGEIDIIFTAVDIEAVLDDEDNLVDVDTLVDAIADADTVETTVTVPYVLEDEEWKVEDVEDVYNYFIDLFEDASFVTFTPNLVDCIDYADWWFDEGDGVYGATSTIDLELYFIEGTDYSGVNYDITYNGEVIYTGSGYDAWVSAYETTVADENDYYPAGNYTITFYDAEGNEIYSDTCTVTEDYVPTETTAAGTSTSDNITVVEGDDFYTLYFYSDDSYTSTVSGISADDSGIYMQLRTWAYYDIGATFSVDVTIDGEYAGTLEYENPEDFNDTAYIAIEWDDGSAIGAGEFVLDITGYDGSNYATVTIDIA